MKLLKRPKLLINPLSVTGRIRWIMNHYKAHFVETDQKERYKWEAVGWYRKHWDLQAPDFGEMLKTALAKTANLLASGMYYPYKMIVAYAQEDPEEVRRIFGVLYDENMPLEERYFLFRDSCTQWVTGKNTEKPLNHYQDLRAIMVYLTCEYPETYYFYKSTLYTTVRDRIGFAEDKGNGTLGKFYNYDRMCQLFLAEVRKDPELIAMHKARLDAACYADEALHLLTMDILFYGGVYMEEGDFPEQTSEAECTDYFPTREEYDPGMTVDMWRTALQDATVTSPENLDMLRKLLALGGESTCAHLAEVYGNTAGYYNGLGAGFAGKVKKRFHCPDCVDLPGDDDHNRIYVVAFVGRYVTEQGNRRYSWRLRRELQEALEDMDSKTDIGLNTILYGPPGTGKTYHTVLYGVAIIEQKKLAAVAQEDYGAVLERYRAYKAQRRIEFTTFHQSYGYEDFIEGIKPMPDSGEEDTGNIRYGVQPGVFKQFCERAQQPQSLAKVFDIGENPTIWKVSLGGTGDNPIRTECLEHSHIRIGWDDYGASIADVTDFSGSGGKTVLKAFLYDMQVGDLVMSCYSASTIDAIGVVTGDYEWHDEYPTMKRLRKVKWIVKGIRENIVEINGGKKMTLSSVYRLSVSLADTYRLLEKHLPKQLVPIQNENYVFIIDEINRGNISKIFGELITLMEPSKRIGCQEEVTVKLPYSQTPFGVPQNVYIVGTMNTADRSIAAMDTALRRRFQFREMLPDPDVLAEVFVEDLSIRDMLVRMNQRISVLYDREHTIGHAYFLPLKDNPTVETLGEIFRNSILPLLQEYFYEDYEKIRLVLGDNRKSDKQACFVLKTQNNYAHLFGTDIDLDESYRYEIQDSAFEMLEAYRFL